MNCQMLHDMLVSGGIDTKLSTSGNRAKVDKSGLCALIYKCD